MVDKTMDETVDKTIDDAMCALDDLRDTIDCRQEGLEEYFHPESDEKLALELVFVKKRLVELGEAVVEPLTDYLYGVTSYGCIIAADLLGEIGSPVAIPALVDAIETDADDLCEIKKLAGQVKTERIMLYPYAHLSSELAKPLVAVDVLKKLEENLSCDYEVKRAPFGWYKAFTVSCKGHPLSELSRTIRVGTEGRGAKGVGKEEVRVEVVSEALKSEEKAISHWHVLTLEGKLLPIEDFDFKEHPNLLSFADYETSKSRAVDKIPPHVELMRRLELADYEPGSDSGNMRFYPKGTLVKRLLEAHVLDTVGGMGAVEVETPVMYDVNHPTLKKYLDRFPARQYSIESDKRSFFLRFAACFGQFLMNHDMTISHRNLPLKMVEMTRYSFRREQHGELVGLRRLRAFTMPDMHTLCADMDHAIDEFKDQYTMCMKMLADIGLDDDYEVAIRFTRDFYRENQDFIKELVGIVGKPALIELWDSRFFYFVIKFEFNYISASTLSCSSRAVSSTFPDSARMVTLSTPLSTSLSPITTT